MRGHSRSEEGRKNSMKQYFKSHALGWLGAIIVLLGYYLNANHCASSWLVWIVGNSCVGYYCFEKKAYAAGAMSFALIIFNIYGYTKWLDF